MNVMKGAKPCLVWRTRHLTLNCPSSVIVSITCACDYECECECECECSCECVRSRGWRLSSKRMGGSSGWEVRLKSTGDQVQWRRCRVQAESLSNSGCRSC